MGINISLGHVGKTPGKTLTNYEINLFNELFGESHSSKDANQASNIMIVMISIGLLNRTLPLEERLMAVVGQKWKFIKPIRESDTISVSFNIKENKKTRESNHKIVIIGIETINQHSEIVAAGDWTILINAQE